MDRIVKSFCLECEWTARTDTVANRNTAMIDHHVTTGHDIESVSCAAVSQSDAVDESSNSL